MNRLAFQEAVRRLHCIDFDPLVAAGIMAADDPRWREFRDNPVGFMIRADDETADKLWDLITVGRRPFPGEAEG